MIVRSIAAAMTALVCGLVQAEEPKYTPAYTACQEKSGGADAAMLDCVKAEYQTQDKKLNDAYRSLMANLPGKDKSALKASQRDWIRSRNSTCDFHNRMADGSMATLVQQSCYLDAVIQRAGLLSYWNHLKGLSK